MVNTKDTLMFILLFVVIAVIFNIATAMFSKYREKKVGSFFNSFLVLGIMTATYFYCSYQEMLRSPPALYKETHYVISVKPMPEGIKALFLRDANGEIIPIELLDQIHSNASGLYLLIGNGLEFNLIQVK